MHSQRFEQSLCSFSHVFVVVVYVSTPHTCVYVYLFRPYRIPFDVWLSYSYRDGECGTCLSVHVCCGYTNMLYLYARHNIVYCRLNTLTLGACVRCASRTSTHTHRIVVCFFKKKKKNFGSLGGPVSLSRSPYLFVHFP